jgi:hypothetical protein
MAGIFKNGVFSMGFDMDPAGAAIFNSSSSGSNYGSANSSVVPFASGYSWNLTNQYVVKYLSTNLTTLIVGIRAYVTLPASNNTIFAWYDVTGAGYQLNLQLFSDGHIAFYSGGGLGSLIGSASAAGLIATNTWVYFETKVTINSSTGLVECRINGNSTPVISSSGVNTQSTANAWVSGFQLNSVTTGAAYYDDWYMLDTTGTSPLNTYLGNVEVKGDKPNNNSAVAGRNAFTPTTPTGSNYQNVGNIPFSATEYNADSNPGDYDMFRFPTLNAVSVLFLNEWVVAELDAAGARTVALDCYSNGTDAQGAAFTPGSTPTMYNQPFTVDPHTSAAWSVANAEAAELGLQVVT